MYSLNNWDFTEKPVSNTYTIKVDGVSIAYTYIRKNACSSFKKFFSHFSHGCFSEYKTDLAALNQLHVESSLDKLSSCDFRIFVFRDPIDRAISVYKNKFIQNTGNKDIFQSYEKITGRDAFKASFEEFISLYIMNQQVSERELDPHLYSQHLHLRDINYNAVIPMNSLYDSMQLVVGAALAQKFFEKPVNASTSNIESERERNVVTQSAEELNQIFKSEKRIPKSALFRTPTIEEQLKAFYVTDYELINSLKDNSK
ncbi:sulfotransferase family 2 domain-containing protein [Alteromonas sp. S005]|uniref:sulfotransferase family 2 domain-containing protein n=1 Tax=Alteromonas sp. S005 TaxID=3117400 RepID=UPI002FDF5E05